ncbi:MAG: hypothetical protein WC325_11330 [Candidatus Bathyarchaeia archaeon]|jgi:hypothetical protein
MSETIKPQFVDFQGYCKDICVDKAKCDKTKDDCGKLSRQRLMTKNLSACYFCQYTALLFHDEPCKSCKNFSKYIDSGRILFGNRYATLKTMYASEIRALLDRNEIIEKALKLSNGKIVELNHKIVEANKILDDVPTHNEENSTPYISAIIRLRGALK